MDSEAQERAENTLIREKEALSTITITPEFKNAVEILSTRSGNIILTGMGKSSFIAMKLAATFTSLGHHSSFLHPTEAMHGDSGIIHDDDILICISFSGESIEIVKLAKYCKDTFSVPIIALTGKEHSRLATLSDVALKIAVEKEGCPLDLAPMASVTTTLVVGDMLASALTKPEDFSEKHFAKFHPGGSIGLKLTKISEKMHTGKEIPCIEEQTSIHDVLVEITEKKKGITAVVDENKKIVGAITDGDIRRFFLKHESQKGFTAKDIMTKNPRYILENSSLQEALLIMEEHKITSLFVVDKKQSLMGIIHIHDIIEHSF